MRIIAGIFKGRKILLPVDKSTRPLKDMVRESIFNILEHSKLTDNKLKNLNVLDLYSGIGSFGLECLSRGARKVFFVEKHVPTLEILKKYIKSLNCENKCQIIENDVTKLKEFSKISNHKFNLFFLDPPFKDKNVSSIVDLIHNMKIVDKKGIIIIHRNKDTEEKYNEKMKLIRIENYGKSKIIFNQFVD